MAPQRFSSLSRRSFLQASTAASAALALRIVTEPVLAFAKRPPVPPGSVMIDSNENPLGPCDAAREAVAAIIPQSGRYLDPLTDQLLRQLAENFGVTDEHIRVFAGSSEPLHYTVMAFTSPRASYVTADPGFESGAHAAKSVGAR